MLVFRIILAMRLLPLGVFLQVRLGRQFWRSIA
jgi:uncharacterized membrane protein YqaE (UPF0057 family)